RGKATGGDRQPARWVTEGDTSGDNATAEPPFVSAAPQLLSLLRRIATLPYRAHVSACHGWAPLHQFEQLVHHVPKPLHRAAKPSHTATKPPHHARSQRHSSQFSTRFTFRFPCPRPT